MGENDSGRTGSGRAADGSEAIASVVENDELLSEDVEELCRIYASDSGHVALPIACCGDSAEFDEELHEGYTVLPVLISDDSRMHGDMHVMSASCCNGALLPMITRSHGDARDENALDECVTDDEEGPSMAECPQTEDECDDELLIDDESKMTIERVRARSAEPDISVRRGGDYSGNKVGFGRGCTITRPTPTPTVNVSKQLQLGYGLGSINTADLRAELASRVPASLPAYMRTDYMVSTSCSINQELSACALQ